MNNNCLCVSQQFSNVHLMNKFKFTVRWYLRRNYFITVKPVTLNTHCGPELLFTHFKCKSYFSIQSTPEYIKQNLSSQECEDVYRF